jgi:hypothetical protein
MIVKPILQTSSAVPSSDSLDPVLQQRFSSLNIPLDHTVLHALANFHSSQVKSALNHIEANFELIRSPKAVFLYQLPKQPLDDHRPLLPVFSARNFSGFTIQHLKVWYPNHWQRAALHFGLSIDI